MALVNGITTFRGPEGSGKSLALTSFSIRHYDDGGRILTFPGYSVQHPRTGEPLSEDLAMEDWLALGPDLQEGDCVDIDEVQKFFDARRFASNVNMLFGYLCAERRHRQMGIQYTAQEFGWVDRRIEQLTHVYIMCWDYMWSPYWRKRGLGRGERIRLTYIDAKGFYTGRRWSIGPKIVMQGRPFWNAYDTHSITDLAAGMVQVGFKKPKYEVDLTQPDRFTEQGPEYSALDGPGLTDELAHDSGMYVEPPTNDQANKIIENLNMDEIDLATRARLGRIMKQAQRNADRRKAVY